MARGRELGRAIALDADHAETLASIRVWQRDCEDIVRHLSGGSKAHWVSRAYSQAFLIPSSGQTRVEQAEVAQIVARLIDVLQQAAAAVSQPAATTASAGAPPTSRRFDFVHHTALRPVLERAYADSRDAFDEQRFAEALVLSCSTLEAIITDALEHLNANGALAQEGRIADWSFEARIAAAEQAGAIRNGCARLPAVARSYRDLTDADGTLRRSVSVSERDARVAAQVLHVIMRDLNPGR